MKRLLLTYLAILSVTVGEEVLLTRTRMLMGTYASLSLPPLSNKTISEAFGLIDSIDRSLSTFDPNASLSKLNHTHRIPFDPVLAEALKRSRDYYYETDGYFDITIGSITKNLYRFGESDPGDPTPEALYQATRDIGGFSVTDNTIESREGIVIDLGGMGKGFAVDKVAVWLGERNITHGMVGLSGDIRCIGPCELYIQSPFTEGVFARLTARVDDLSVSTSGTYRRYARSREKHHLIDPKSAQQGNAFVSVTLFTRADNTRIDAYATALSVMPLKKALALLQKHPQIGYLLIEPDGTVHRGNLEGLVTLRMLPLQRKSHHTKKQER
jgi:thiamine biosynthesis lipoprotein